MDPKITSYPAFTVIGAKYHGRNQHGEIPQLWHRFADIMNSLPAGGSPAYGVCGNHDAASGEFDYLAGGKVEPGTAPPEGLAVWDVPEQTYAVFPTTLATLHQTMDHIYREWFPASPWRPADGPSFELYDEEFCHGSGTLYVYAAVVKR